MITSRPILFLATANDRDDRARYLRNLAEEARQVQRALAAAEARGYCELALRQNATAGDILDVFQDARTRGRIALFHFGGHADGYRLLLETATGQPVAADAGGLARFLAQQRGLALVFLNGCSTAGQVSDLLDAGVQAVIATDQAVEDGMATAFAARFYQGLAGGAAIGPAFEEAKAAIQMQGGRAFRHLGAAEEADGDRLPWRLHTRAGAESVAGWSLPLAAADPLFGLPELPPLDLPDKPYRYLDWYRREDAGIFFGRGREIRQLYDRVTAPDGPPIVLLYGQSGVGKSSLLAAGLLPRLEAGHAVRYARRDQALGLAGTLAAALGTGPDADPAAAWRGLEAETGRPLLVILDQVEELYTRPNLGQPDEMAAFLAAATALFGDPGLRPAGRLILSFRKEWLAEITARLAESDLPRAEVFLERLDRAGIVEVVAGPRRTARLRSQYDLEIGDPLLPGQIADDLLADRESPVAPMLAILLADMWEAAKARSYDRPAFDTDLYHNFRSRGLSLDDFLGRQLRALHDKQPEVVASGLALDVLAYHTTPLGTAEQRTLAEMEQTYGHRQDVLPALVQECRDLYLLVDPSRNQPDQAPASRLTHDTLAPHVRKRFDESDQPGQRARRILESRAVQWRNGQSGPVLDGPDLAAVEAGCSGMRAWDEEKGEIHLIQASQLARRKRQRQRWLVSSALLTLVVMLLLAVNWGALRNLWLRSEALQASPQADAGKLKVDLYEVSITLYDRCYRAAPERCPAPEGSEAFSRFKQGMVAEYGDMPVTNVSALNAANYCQWLGRQLPSSADWETIAAQVYADRLQVDGTLMSADGLNLGSSVLERVSGAGIQATDARSPLHLIGNVWEWTSSLETNDEVADADAIWNSEDVSVSLLLRGGSSESPILTDLKLTKLWTAALADFSGGEDFGFRCIAEQAP